MQNLKVLAFWTSELSLTPILPTFYPLLTISRFIKALSIYLSSIYDSIFIVKTFNAIGQNQSCDARSQDQYPYGSLTVK